MDAPVWLTYAASPLGFGGVAQFLVRLKSSSTHPFDQIEEARVLVGTSSFADPNDKNAQIVDLVLGNNVQTYADGLPPGNVVLSWFARINAGPKLNGKHRLNRGGRLSKYETGWFNGPITTADLSPTWVSDFSYPKNWVVSTLQQMELQTLPLGGGKHLPIRSAYPRDNFPIPCISVNLEASQIGNPLVGDIARSLTLQKTEERIGWNITLDILLWCDSPEDRDALAPWLLQCVQALTHLAPYNNLENPTFSFTESEDFSGGKAERPLFITGCQLLGIMWSKLTVPVRTCYGHLTV